VAGFRHACCQPAHVMETRCAGSDGSRVFPEGESGWNRMEPQQLWARLEQGFGGADSRRTPGGTILRAGNRQDRGTRRDIRFVDRPIREAVEEREPAIERNAATNCEDWRSWRQIACKRHEFVLIATRAMQQDQRWLGRIGAWDEVVDVGHWGHRHP
jgi:hypothetical protein